MNPRCPSVNAEVVQLSPRQACGDCKPNSYSICNPWGAAQIRPFMPHAGQMYAAITANLTCGIINPTPVTAGARTLGRTIVADQGNVLVVQFHITRIHAADRIAVFDGDGEGSVLLAEFSAKHRGPQGKIVSNSHQEHVRLVTHGASVFFATLTQQFSFSVGCMLEACEEFSASAVLQPTWGSCAPAGAYSICNRHSGPIRESSGRLGSDTLGNAGVVQEAPANVQCHRFLEAQPGYDIELTFSVFHVYVQLVPCMRSCIATRRRRDRRRPYCTIIICCSGPARRRTPRRLAADGGGAQGSAACN